MAGRRIELRFHGYDLKTGLFKKVNSQLFAYIKGNGDSDFRFLGLTEQTIDHSKPYFQKPIFVEFFENTNQTVKLVLLNTENDSPFTAEPTINEKNLIGESDPVSVDKLLPPGTKTVINLKKDGKDSGTLDCRTYENLPTGKMITFRVKMTDLDKKDLFGLSDPYFFLSKVISHTDKPTVYKSPVIMKDLNPVYPDTITMRLEDFNGGNIDTQIHCMVYDWNSNGTAATIGFFFTTTRDLMGGKREFNIINDKKTNDKHYRNSGVFHFLDFNVYDA
ncbi:phospholipid-binding protein [Tieghemostelium lacteum]|uniref:Phospholipid-binding protein n=1 Tax=Tieghemostelium lacteum TaxID=361077 RepID=A0A151ZF38_TIELA|nr:phospholipid-binding protein [Tieghemostelium lacteum]|eukprot:KYQ92529.1 phospholipid-binding protein [Tieghemostelium lacteum]